MPVQVYVHRRGIGHGKEVDVDWTARSSCTISVRISLFLPSCSDRDCVEGLLQLLKQGGKSLASPRETRLHGEEGKNDQEEEEEGGKKERDSSSSSSSSFFSLPSSRLSLPSSSTRRSVCTPDGRTEETQGEAGEGPAPGGKRTGRAGNEEREGHPEDADERQLDFEKRRIRRGEGEEEGEQGGTVHVRTRENSLTKPEDEDPAFFSSSSAFSSDLLSASPSPSFLVPRSSSPPGDLTLEPVAFGPRDFASSHRTLSTQAEEDQQEDGRRQEEEKVEGRGGEGREAEGVAGEEQKREERRRRAHAISSVLRQQRGSVRDGGADARTEGPKRGPDERRKESNEELQATDLSQSRGEASPASFSSPMEIFPSVSPPHDSGVEDSSDSRRPSSPSSSDREPSSSSSLSVSAEREHDDRRGSRQKEDRATSRFARLAFEAAGSIERSREEKAIDSSLAGEAKEKGGEKRSTRDGSRPF